MDKLFIGIDVGTSGTKTIIINQRGEVLRSKTVTYDNIVEKPGWSEVNAQLWWDAVMKTLKSVLDGIDHQELCALSFSGQMHGMTPLDADGNPVRPAILWNDTRNQAECDWIEQTAGGLEALTLQTNNRMLVGYTGGKILWMKNHEPENYKKTVTVLNPKDYIRYKLTGLQLTEVSDASGTGLFNVKERKFCDGLIEQIGLRRSLFPDAVESTDITGAVTAEAAGLTGLPEGLPVVGGGGDAVLQTTSMGLSSPGVLGVVLGTSGVVAMGFDHFVQNDGSLQMFCNNAPGMWHAMGIVVSAAGSLKWYKDALCAHEDDAARQSGRHVYALLDEEAEAVPPGSDGLFFLPYLSGERCPHTDPDARGVFLGLSLKTTHAAMTRSVMEGVTYASRSVWEALSAMDPSKPTRIITSGGGASSALWRQMLADVFRLPVYTLSGSAEGGAYGAALLAGVGVGAWSSLNDAMQVLKVETETLPSEQTAEIYEKHYQIYKGLYHMVKPAFAQIAAL